MLDFFLLITNIYCIALTLLAALLILSDLNGRSNENDFFEKIEDFRNDFN